MIYRDAAPDDVRLAQLDAAVKRRGERDKAIAMAKSALDLDAEHEGARTLIALLGRR